MEKQKLAQTRTNKGITQQQAADFLNIDVSNYNRREKGSAKIISQEWEKLSKLLKVPVEEIYENEESVFIVCKDQAVGIVNGTNNVYTVPEFLLDSQRKYILKLEEENEQLKAQIKK
jgi:transcriptional regulator with XRE-family HTH domain